MGSYVRRSWDLVRRPAISARSRDPDFSLTAQRNIDELFRATNGLRLLQGASVEAVGLAESFNRRLNIPTNNVQRNTPGEADTGDDNRTPIEEIVTRTYGGSNGAAASYATTGTSFSIPLSYDTAIDTFAVMFQSSGGGSMTGKLFLKVDGTTVTTAAFGTSTKTFPYRQLVQFQGNVIKGQQQGQRVFFKKGSVVTFTWTSFSPAGHFLAFEMSLAEKRIRYV